VIEIRGYFGIRYTIIVKYYSGWRLLGMLAYATFRDLVKQDSNVVASNRNEFHQSKSEFLRPNSSVLVPLYGNSIKLEIARLEISFERFPHLNGFWTWLEVNLDIAASVFVSIPNISNRETVDYL
jgi:hypothetical protein